MVKLHDSHVRLPFLYSFLFFGGLIIIYKPFNFDVILHELQGK